MRHEAVEGGSERVVRLGLGGIIAGVVAIILAGVAGGMISRYLGGGGPLPIREEQFVTTVQEVTISPNTARAELVRAAESSVYLLVRLQAERYDILGTAVALTNDGLLATAAAVPEGAALGVLDAEGRRLSVSRVGQDVLYGVSYMRLTSAIVTPLDIEGEDSAVGTELVVLSREPESLALRAAPVPISRYELPPAIAAPGVQRVAVGEALEDAHLVGSPVINEDGRLSGLVLNAATGAMLPATHVRASFERLAAQQREANPLDELGLTVNYDFSTASGEQPVRFGLTVEQAVPGGPAYGAGLRRGDRITQVGETELAWDRLTLPLLQAPLPLSLTVQRGDEELVLTITAPASE